MLPQRILNALCVMLIAYLLFAYTNRDGIDLPRPTQGYYFVPNETQKLLGEAKKEAARVAAAQEAARQLGSGQAPAGALAHYGVALKEGDEGLAAAIDYVHQYRRLAAASQAAQPPVSVHVFLAADNGTYSGMHELFYITAAMRYSTPLRIDGCRSALLGFLEKPTRNPLTWGVDNAQCAANESAAAGLRKIPVLAITTGIYVTSSAACTAAVMELPMFRVLSMTLIGTSGVSPVVGGGGWNPTVPAAPRHGSKMSVEGSEAAANPSCQQHWAPNAQKVAIGSVCVTYGSLLQECGLCEEENDLTSLCSRPRCRMQNSTTFFGPCGFRHPTSAFAEQMKGAMYGRPFPSPPPVVREAMQVFWEANEAATDYVARAGADEAENADPVLLYNRLPPKEPILLNCAEVSTNQILAGPRSDVLCRQYTEELFGGLYAAKDLSCVQAMEGMGVLHVMTRDHPNVPVAIVRGASNYDMFPLARRVHRVGGADGPMPYVAWDQKEHYLADDEFHRYTRFSYQYSIETASAVVLNYFLSAETVLPGM